MKKTIYFAFLMTFMSLFVACTDDDDDASGTDSGFTEEVVVVNPACDDYTYQLKTDKQWKAEIADQWHPCTLPQARAHQS